MSGTSPNVSSLEPTAIRTARANQLVTKRRGDLNHNEFLGADVALVQPEVNCFL
jgi:hypothetical protein